MFTGLVMHMKLTWHEIAVRDLRQTQESPDRFRLRLALWYGETTCMESLSQLAQLFVRPHKTTILSLTALGSSVEGLLAFMV